MTFIWLFFVFVFRYHSFPDFTTAVPGSLEHARLGPHSITHTSQSIIQSAQYFLDYPLKPPYKEIFGELGERSRLLRSWVEKLEANKHLAAQFTEEEQRTRERAANLTIKVAESLFPYLKPKSHVPHNLSPLENLRRRISDTDYEAPVTGPNNLQDAGIVIPTGQHTLRFASHLIASLTRVHRTRLPIQVVYAGDEDLPAEGRKVLQESAQGVEIEFLDVLSVFDDKTLKLGQGGWAIKPFAALASRFDQVILLDADTVFLQDPEALLKQTRYQDTGALLFHDRLLWKNGFKDRQDWWHDQIKRPSSETDKSLVWTERYSEEGDSGIVVVDKARLDILIGLLHVGWQNSYAVRTDWTYKVTYGDKETWWIGFEATGSTYAFSQHYGGMIGWLAPEDEKEKRTETKPEDSEKKEAEQKKKVKVCSFVIAHVDESEKLLWYNGGLLKNKLADQTEYDIPTHWMVDQEWKKGGKKDMSCMVGTEVNEVSEQEREVLRLTIEVAQDVDARFNLVPE